MENIKENLIKFLAQNNAVSVSFKRNLAKEYLQIAALDFIYSHKVYGQLVFYGGSCLKHCHDLPRLSEDLDFVDLKKEIDIADLAADLKNYFFKTSGIEIKTTVQKFRIYLKFPILRELGLADKSESELLFLKVEIFTGFDFCGAFKTEIIPIFKYSRSILVKSFDLPTLMATKIRAVFHRKWEKTDKSGKVAAKVKGRDYFDLMWYLQKGISPNLDCIENIKDTADLKKKLMKAIAKVDEKSIYIDLEPLLADANFIKNLSKTIKQILITQVKAIK
ncbi:MAG: nucleotidyl transferase AbiEii/AbiGii toxin family protein [Candidatus Paceibacterota bacterium]